MTENPLEPYLALEDRLREPALSHVDAILEAVRRHLGMEIAFAARYVGDEREFTHISAAIPVPVAPGAREPVEQSYCWHILNGRLPELIHDSARIPFAATLPISAALPVGCHISVPLRLKDGSVYGSFCCLSRQADESLTGRDLATVHAFAALAAAQIELANEADQRKRSIAARVEAAIGSAQPTIFLQPIHGLDDGVCVGAEALARFPDCLDRPPSDWFDEATSAGCGIPLELAAVRRALAALPYVPSGQYLSINVSPATILSGELEPLLAAAAGDRDVVLEVTEHSRIEDYDDFVEKLAPLRRLVRIAIDDVGAGYSGLRQIISLRPDILKLDLSLTRDIDRDVAKRALALAMVSFAGKIGAVIVAEGVERPEERQVLRELGISYGQGWLFSKAMPVVTAQQCLLGASRESGGGEPALARPRRRAA